MNVSSNFLWLQNIASLWLTTIIGIVLSIAKECGPKVQHYTTMLLTDGHHLLLPASFPTDCLRDAGSEDHKW